MNLGYLSNLSDLFIKPAYTPDPLLLHSSSNVHEIINSVCKLINKWAAEPNFIAILRWWSKNCHYICKLNSSNNEKLLDQLKNKMWQCQNGFEYQTPSPWQHEFMQDNGINHASLGCLSKQLSQQLCEKILLVPFRGTRRCKILDLVWEVCVI